VNLLLDTHVWVWSQEDPERLGPEARSSLLDEHDIRLLSADDLILKYPAVLSIDARK